MDALIIQSAMREGQLRQVVYRFAVRYSGGLNVTAVISIGQDNELENRQRVPAF